jgi:D-3-phosphoglycerate dehydrogenase
MLNKSRDDVAYTLVDLENEISDDVINKLSEVEGILTVRKI